MYFYEAKRGERAPPLLLIPLIFSELIRFNFNNYMLDMGDIF